MKVIHVELKEANEFVATHHRHHRPTQGHRFSLGVEKDGELIGVAIVGRPVSRNVDQKNIVEVTRLCTDGTKNACSFLYGASVRAARALGYWAIQTYILKSEHGSSLKAANWTKSHDTSGGSWTRNTRNRREDQPQCAKQCWKYVIHPYDSCRAAEK